MADPVHQRTVPPLPDGGPAGTRPAAGFRSRAIDAERSPEEFDLATLAHRIAGRLDEVLDEHALLRRRDEAEARHEEAVRIWTEAIARGARGDVLRKRALAATIQRSAGTFEIVDAQADRSAAVEPKDEAAASPDAGEATDEPGAADAIETPSTADASAATDEAVAPVPDAAPPVRTVQDVVPDVDATDAKLQTVRRRLEGRRAVASRPPPTPTPFWRRPGVTAWTKRVAWGAAIVALSVLISSVVL